MKSKSNHWRIALFPIILYLFLFVATFYSFKSLPKPVEATKELKFSEGNCMETVKVLASDIGMRVVGTPQETMTITYLWDVLGKLQKTAHPLLTFERFKQNSDGSHKFEIMEEPVIKTYSNITNIIVKLSCAECSTDAVLLNSHFDSTIVTPGASDDSASVGIMLEVLRILSQETRLKKSIVFLFNGAEETLQDASHAFVTQHELAKSIKVFVYSNFS
jgi:Peptidase family M28